MGDISQLHMTGLNMCKDKAKVVGVWNRAECPIVTQNVVEQRAADVGAINYGTAEELVKNDDIDVVFVLTNMETHFQVLCPPISQAKSHCILVRKAGNGARQARGC